MKSPEHSRVAYPPGMGDSLTDVDQYHEVLAEGNQNRPHSPRFSTNVAPDKPGDPDHPGYTTLVEDGESNKW